MVRQIYRRSWRSMGRVLRKCRNLGKEEVLVVGDSHAAVFNRIPTKGRPYWLNVVSVGGATISGLENPNSVTQARPAFEEALSVSRSNTCVVILGEVDLGFVIWYRAAKHGYKVEEILDQTFLKYGEFLQGISARRRVICVSAPLPMILDGQRWGEVANKRCEVTATQRERTELTLKLNRRMEQFSLTHGLTYLNLDGESIGEDGLVKETLRSRIDADHHYDPAAYLNLLTPKLDAALSTWEDKSLMS